MSVYVNKVLGRAGRHLVVPYPKDRAEYAALFGRCDFRFTPEEVLPILFGGELEDRERPTYREARAVVVGVPADITGTFRRRTTLYGPAAMRAVSALQNETFVLDVDPPRNWYDTTLVYDAGDITVGKGDKIEHVISRGRQVVTALRRDGKIPIFLGGEHSISSSSLPALALPQKKSHLLIFDKHLDFKDKYFGERHNHTTWLRRYVEDGYLGGITIIGVEQCGKKEYEAARKAGISVFKASDVERNIRSVEEHIAWATHGRKVGVSFDFDALESAHTPATGTTGAGITQREARRLLDALQGEVVYLDFNEVGFDPSNPNFAEPEFAVRSIFRLLAQGLNSRDRPLSCGGYAATSPA